MAETVNISRIAEYISKNLFLELGWEQEGPANINWACEDKSHNKKTHPSDIVFSYQEPYDAIRTYINCDLKSYARDSLTNSTLLGALQSLIMSVNCAQKSKEWQNNYLRGDDTPNIVGLLFIYNHDGLYDKNFMNIFNSALIEKVNIPKNTKIFILSPDEICALSTIVNDIQTSRGKNELPQNDLCSFFYPDRISRVARKEWKLPATLETIKSSFLVMKHKSCSSISNYNGVTIYYKRNGSNVEEFIYLVDYLFHWQMISEDISIKIKLTNPSTAAPAVFNRAIKDYVGRYNITKELSERLKDIKLETIKTIVTTFNETEIGMDEHGI
jgi:hypothetical protein